MRIGYSDSNIEFDSEKKQDAIIPFSWGEKAEIMKGIILVREKGDYKIRRILVRYE